jgi:hypothetical protein
MAVGTSQARIFGLSEGRKFWGGGHPEVVFQGPEISNILGAESWQGRQNEKDHNLIIRNPILMIVGSFQS